MAGVTEALLKRPGWWRALTYTILGGAFGVGLVVLLREISGLPIWQTEQTGYPHVVVPAITAPLGFLIGIGCFDYWFRWAVGAPTFPAEREHENHGAYSLRDYFKVNTDHKVIGIQYLVTTFFFFFFGGMLAMIMRAELAQPGTQIVDPSVFNGLFSTHAALMIFVFVIPAFAGVANYVLPLMIGAPDMAFPRLNALSYWMLPVAGILFIASYFCPGGAFDAGWTGYAPLSTGAPLGQSFFNLGVQFAGASSIATALNFLVTIVTMRAPGMNFWRLPLLVWANLSTSLLVVAATPFIAGVQFMVLFDRALGTQFFQAAFGGDVVSYQHIFWFYSHPAVYIMMLPGFGIVSEVISTHSRKPIFGYRLMALALIGIVVLSYSVWAHHMFVAGMFSWLRVPMMITTLLIAVPTGIKIFSWLGTLFHGVIHLRSTAMLFALALHRHLHHRRDLRGDARNDPDRHPRLGHLFRRRPHPLRPLRRLGVHDLRRRLPLVPEDDRADVRRAARPDPLLGHAARNVGHVHPDALDRDGGDAPPGGRLRGDLRGLEPADLLLRVHARGRSAGLPLQHDRQLALRAEGRSESMAGEDDRVAGLLAAAGLQLRRDSAGRRRPL